MGKQLIAYFFLYALVSTNVGSACNTYIVDKNGLGDFTTIQAAVDASNDCDTIYVNDGVYDEQVVVPAGLDDFTIKGSTKAIVNFVPSADSTRRYLSTINVGVFPSAGFDLETGLVTGSGAVDLAMNPIYGQQDLVSALFRLVQGGNPQNGVPDKLWLYENFLGTDFHKDVPCPMPFKYNDPIVEQARAFQLPSSPVPGFPGQQLSQGLVPGLGYRFFVDAVFNDPNLTWYVPSFPRNKNFKLDGLTLQGAERSGIYLYGVDGYILANSVYKNNSQYGPNPVCSLNGLIENNVASGHLDGGIYVGKGGDAVVKNNISTNNAFGYSGENTVNVVLEGNQFINNGIGIVIGLTPGYGPKESKDGVIKDNIIVNNNNQKMLEESGYISSLPAGVGILLFGHDFEIKNNKFTNNNTFGILTYDNFNHAVSGLEVSGSPVFVDFSFSSRGFPFTYNNTIKNNIFTNNGKKPNEVWVETNKAIYRYNGLPPPENVSLGADILVSTPSLQDVQGKLFAIPLWTHVNLGSPIYNPSKRYTTCIKDNAHKSGNGVYGYGWDIGIYRTSYDVLQTYPDQTIATFPFIANQGGSINYHAPDPQLVSPDNCPNG